MVIRLAGALHLQLLRIARTVPKYSIDLEHIRSTESSERNTPLVRIQNTFLNYTNNYVKWKLLHVTSNSFIFKSVFKKFTNKVIEIAPQTDIEVGMKCSLGAFFVLLNKFYKPSATLAENYIYQI